jgi:hypothetical protein
MAVRIVRLLAGEEILGDVDVVEERLRITNPTIIMAVPNPKTHKVDVQMAPFTPLSAEKHIDLSPGHVLFMYEPVVDIVNKYNSMYGSGIILPNTGLGVPGLG